MDPVLVLASASPRRAQILRGLGLAFRVVVSEVAEDVLAGEGPEAAAERLARAKAAAVATAETLPVLAADTLVACEGRALGKPSSAEDARAMLRLLSGRRHDVVTGVCLAANGVVRSSCERTTVTFAALTEEEIGWYVASGEPMDKAGAYHAFGLGALFITRIEGSPSNVAGLPVRVVLALARAGGLRWGPP